MSDHDERDPVMAAASAVADGAVVEWGRVEAGASAAEREDLRQLQIIAEIALLYRTGDIVQKTVAEAVGNLDRFDVRGDGARQAYLRQALNNRLAETYRRGRTRSNDAAVDPDLSAPLAALLDAAIDGRAGRRYQAALDRLQPLDREAVILRVELCYEYDHLARMLDKSSAGAARVAVSRALARLSREMQS